MQEVTRRQTDSGTADFQALQALNQGFIRSVRMSDVAWFDRNLSDDFLNSNADGTLVDRAAFLRQIAPPCPVSNFSVEDVRIRIFGDTAIVHGRTTYTKPDGEAGAGRYSDVWVRRGARWVCVSGDVTRG
jgi:ketosteroid isomerase-like protein